MPTIPDICIVCSSVPNTYTANNLLMWRCPNCHLMWRKSFDVPVSHYEEAGGGFSKSKEKLQRRNIKDRIRTIRKYVHLDNTCDVGGSKGYFVDELLKSGYVGAYGIDPNRTQVEASVRRGIPMLTGSTEDLSTVFGEKKTQNVTLFHVIEHLPNPVKVIKEIYDALPSGGYFVVETPDFDSYSFQKLNYIHKLIYKEHLFYFTFDNLQTLLTKMGFHIVYAEKRDFDQYHLNIRESLFRLGFPEGKEKVFILRRIVVKLLSVFSVPFSFLVKLLHRGNFVLVISRKD